MRGTWLGTLESSWAPLEKKGEPEPIEIAVVISQTASTCDVTLRSPQSASRSLSAEIIVDDLKRCHLIVTYLNHPQTLLRDESPIHYGTMNCELSRKPDFNMRGEYWTSRKTVGQVILKRISKDLDVGSGQ
jgi:hypothetical protein